MHAAAPAYENVPAPHAAHAAAVEPAAALKRPAAHENAAGVVHADTDVELAGAVCPLGHAVHAAAPAAAYELGKHAVHEAALAGAKLPAPHAAHAAAVAPPLGLW